MQHDEQDIRHYTITVDGIRSPVREAGPMGASEAVVFLHGHPGSSEDWIDLLPVAGRHLRAVALDLPGFGMASKPRDFDYTIPCLASHLAAVFTELGVDRAHLVLHDFGCFVGLAWAFEHQEQVQSLVLINIGIMPGYNWHLAAKIWRMPILGELSMYTLTRPAFRIGLRLLNPRPLPREFVDRMYREYDLNTRRAALQLYRSIDNPGRASRLIGEALSGKEWPVLVIWSTNDVFLPVTFAHRQREFFPNAEVAIVPDSGHWPFVDEPGLVGGLLDRFYTRIIRV